MRRATGITLVLLGSTVAVGLYACPTRRDECEQARAQVRPDAEEVCSRSSARSGGGYGTNTSFSGGGGGSDGSATGTSGSVRGGFGSTGAGFSSSGG